jgi:asparagine synthase (glutamine-hydrolysing)
VSSIAGVVGLDGAPVEAVQFERLAAGAAGNFWSAKVWAFGEVALAGCSPDRTDGESPGSQPVVSGDGRHVLVFDGRLDNRAELIHALEGTPQGPDFSSDGGIVLAAYRRWSEGCLDRMLGDFAFAVWDRQLKRLFCARDVVGARPFYYVCNRRFFVFASTEDALIRVPGVSSRPAPEQLAFYLVRTFQDVQPDQSWLRDVKILLPAHSVAVTPAGMAEPVEYWRFERGATLRFAGGGDYEDAFLEVFGKAVADRMPSHETPAAIVSGGMDSAALAAMAGRVVTANERGSYRSYSAIADDVGGSLESRSIASITAPPHVEARLLGVPSLAGIASLEDLEDAAWRHAHPVSNAILITTLMCAAARRDRHRTVQHAPAGDLAMGYWPGYLMHHFRHWQWRTAWREARAAADHHTFLEGRSPSRLLLGGAWSAFAPDWLRARVRRLRTPVVRDPEGLELLNPDFAESLRILEWIEQPGAEDTGDAEALFRRKHAESTFGPWGVAPHLAGGQRVGSRYGIDLSDPWADRRVMEFFLHLPVDYLFRDGWTKYLARVSFASDLEDWVRFRSDKEHLGWMVVGRLMRESREFIAQAVSDELELIGEYVDLGRVRELHRQFQEREDPALNDRMFSVMTIFHWVKRLSTDCSVPVQ